MGGESVTPEQQEPTSDLCRIRSMKMIVKSYSTYLSTNWLQCFWTTRWSSFPLPQDHAGKQGRGRGWAGGRRAGHVRCSTHAMRQPHGGREPVRRACDSPTLDAHWHRFTPGVTQQSVVPRR
jgi:hypothetical protein